MRRIRHKLWIGFSSLLALLILLNLLEVIGGGAKPRIVLSACAAVVGLLFIIFINRAILRPMATLMKSFREIEDGNLDLVVNVSVRDELLQLGEAFNSMAAKLREFRRTDRAKLLRTQRTTQLAVDSLPDAIAILGPSGIIDLCNEAARQLFLFKPGLPITSLRDRRFGDLFLEASRLGQPSQARGYESAIEVYDQSGQPKFFLPRAVPICDADRRLLGVTLILADVTNLRRLDEMKSGLLSVVSHELKTPLTSMQMAVHLVLEERVGPLTGKQSDLLSAARDDTDRLKAIIEGLLDMGRLESGQVQLELQVQSAEKLVRDSIAPLESAFHDRCIKLDIEVPSDTGAVLVDPNRIGHVLTNLLTNALKFTSPGGKVSVLVRGEDDVVRFTVHDSGVGIPQEHLNRVFERFYRVPCENKPAGAGLGLAIAKEIVELHGGHISVQSTEGHGSRFSFTLQRSQSSQLTAVALLTSQAEMEVAP
jgi:two-component system, NtrC family, sensor histidine kinase KinB